MRRFPDVLVANAEALQHAWEVWDSKPHVLERVERLLDAQRKVGELLGLNTCEVHMFCVGERRRGLDHANAVRSLLEEHYTGGSNSKSSA